MSETLRPWITDHLIRVAETYGADLTAVPAEAKGKRVQISEFFTFGAENKDSAIWALIHDQKLIVPVKFTKEAVMECNKAFGRRLTDCKTPVVTIKKFRPVSTRTPIRNGGMSSDSHLALICESVSMVGSLGGSKLGSPKDLDSDADLREWSQALRQDGGAGNVLKDRKRAREGKNTPAKHVSPRKPSPTKRIPHIIESVDGYNTRWKDTLLNPLTFARPLTPRPHTPRRLTSPEDARDFGSSSPSEKYSESSSPISGWSPTPARSSPLKASVRQSNPPTPSRSSPKPSSYLTAPTPAQRRMQTPAPGPSSGQVVRKVARPPPPPPVGTGPAQILVPNSDTSQSQPSQPSQPSQFSQPQTLLPSPSQPVALLPEAISQPAQPAPINEDVEMLDEDDKQTDRRLFRRRGSPLERGGPAKKRRTGNENDSPAGCRSKLNGFSVGLDYVERGGAAVVGWERVLAVLSGIV